jgi:hypothetical protein
MKKLVIILLVLSVLSQTTLAQSRVDINQAWPRPIPARIHDGSNRDLLIMTLGDVDTGLADGTFNPLGDEVRLKDGTVIKNYYRDHLKVKYYRALDKTRFPLPPSGWCSWYFYYQEISEDEVKRNAQWIAENLKDYGALYVQVDDGWQGTGHGLGENRDWMTINNRFPSGMNGLASYIKSLGLMPGLWLAPHGQSNEAVIKQNPGAFLLNKDGASASSTWEGKFLVDPSTPEAQKYLKELFTTLSKWGYEYFKIDGQPTVIGEFRKKREFMHHPADDTDKLYRLTLESIRAGIGPDRYLLGCWVVPLEGIGYMNGSRTSADVVLGWQGFKTALQATMQYYFLHNIAWYSDPDVMLLRAPLTLDQARAWATLQGLTGQSLMSSDRLMDLSDERVEMLRRVYPAVDIRPLDLFTSERNKRIWDLKIRHLDRSYDVVGLFNFDEAKASPIHLHWKDLGLPEDRPVHVFDFWNKEYLGAWEKGITLDLSPTSTRVLTLLPQTDEVQLISTSRHITQGWIDLLAAKYDAVKNSCTGRSKVVRADPYELRFVFPRGKNFAIKSATARSDSAKLPVKITNHQGWASVEFTSPAQTTEVDWDVRFEPAPLYHFPVREPANLWAERVGLDGINLRWTAQHQPATGYQVYLNGELLGFTPSLVFPLRGLDPNANYTVEVKTVWDDGTASEKMAQLKFTMNKLLPGEILITELEPLRTTPGWRQLEMNRTIAGKGFMLAAQSYESGIGLPRNSEVEYELKGMCDTFSAIVGIDGGSNDQASEEFLIMGDGKELWRSGVLKKADGPKTVKLNIAGVHRLILRVNAGPAGGGGDQADWVDAKLTTKRKGD